jgi:cell filamentation protein
MTEVDPYCWPGTGCLKNRLMIADPERFRVVEARIVAGRDVLIARNTLPGEYNLEHYKAFHRELFQDVYDWAGELRTVNIHKPGSTFAHWQFVDEQMSSVLHRLVETESLLLGRTKELHIRSCVLVRGN